MKAIVEDFARALREITSPVYTGDDYHRLCEHIGRLFSEVDTSFEWENWRRLSAPMYVSVGWQARVDPPESMDAVAAPWWDPRVYPTREEAENHRRAVDPRTGAHVGSVSVVREVFSRDQGST